MKAATGVRPLYGLTGFGNYLRGTGAADGLLPAPRGAAPLGFVVAILAFLATVAVALTLAGGRLADEWSGALTETVTVQVFAPDDAIEEEARAALNVLRTSPGVRSVRVMDLAEQERLLEPWLGPDISIESLPLPLTIEVVVDRDAFDSVALDRRFDVEAPGAVYDDHAAWRAPLAAAAARLKTFGIACVALLAVALAALLAFAADKEAGAQARDVATLRLVGARDGFIVRALTRRAVLVVAAGSLLGTLAGMALLALLPQGSERGFFLIGIGLSGWLWLWPLLVPIVATLVGWASASVATRRALARG